MAYNNGAVLIAEGHEERIQRLEQNSQSAATKIGQLEVKVDHIVTQNDTLNGKFDDMSKKLDTRITHIDESIEKFVAKLAPITSRIDKLESVETERAARAENRKKIWLSLFIAGAGATVAKLTSFVLAKW